MEHARTNDSGPREKYKNATLITVIKMSSLFTVTISIFDYVKYVTERFKKNFPHQDTPPFISKRTKSSPLVFLFHKNPTDLY